MCSVESRSRSALLGRRWSVLLLTAALLIGATTALAAQPAASRAERAGPPGPPPASAWGQVTGRVVDGSVVPVDGVLVEAWRLREPRPAVLEALATTAFGGQERSFGPPGTFVLAVPPGTYEIRYRSPDDGVDVVAPGQGARLVVTDGSYLDLGDVSLPDLSPARTADLVVDAARADGSPLTEREVLLFEVRNGAIHFLGESTTGASGAATFARAPTGRGLVVCLHSDTGEFTCGAGDPLTPDVPTFRIPLDEAMHTAASPTVVDPTVAVDIRLVGRDGLGVPGLPVSLEPRAPQLGATTDEQGRATVLIRPDDETYVVCAGLASEVVCGTRSGPAAQTFTIPGDARRTAAPDLVLPVEGRVLGEVLDPEGRPVVGAQVYVERVAGSGFTSIVSTGLTDGQGRYSLAHQGRGRHRVCVALVGRAGFQCAEMSGAGNEVMIEDGDRAVTLGTAVTPTPVRVSGRLVRVDGLSAGGEFVELYSVGEPGGRRFVGGTETGPDGSFALVAFPGGGPLTACASLSETSACLGGERRASDAETFVVDPGTGDVDLGQVVLEDLSRAAACGRSSLNGAVLRSGPLSLGLGCFGALGALRAPEGRTQDEAPVGLGLDGRRDVLAPGCLCEGWGLKDGRGQRGGWVEASAFSPADVQLLSFTQTETSALSSVLVEPFTGLFHVTHEALPSDVEGAFLLRITITNVSPRVTFPVYRRTIDWDLGEEPGAERLTMRTEGAPEIVFASNDGFAVPDPLGPRTSRGAIGDVTGSGPLDQGTLWDLDLGRLGPGRTVRFTLALVGAGTAAAAADALDSLRSRAHALVDEAGDTATYALALLGDGQDRTTLPVVRADRLRVERGGQARVRVLDNDLDPLGGRLRVVGTAGFGGEATCRARTCTYRHDGGNGRRDRFLYLVRDERAVVSVGEVRVRVR